MVSNIDNIILVFLIFVSCKGFTGISGSAVRSNTLKERTNRDGEQLEFWDPKPKIVNEKSWQDQISAEYDNFTNYRRSHHHNKYHGASRSRLNSILRRLDNNKIQPINKYHKTEYSKKTDNKSPEYFNFRAKKKPKKGSEETQKEPRPKKTSNTDRSGIPARLNVYNLEKQVGDILSKFPEANVTFDIIGRSASYIDIVLFKLTKLNEKDAYLRADDSKYIDEVPDKNIVLIVHALTVMGITQLFTLSRENYLETLFSYYIKQLDKFDIFLIPMANPDGYVKNQQMLDMATATSPWNKNISPQAGCPGVDVDRNFDVAWNGSGGVSTCNQRYPGPSPFSEPESRAVRDVFHNYGHKIVAYFHVHAGSYDKHTVKGDAVLYPRGFTDVPIDDDKYLDLKGEIDEAMRNATFRSLSVTVDTLHSWYGKVSRTSVDYASTIYGIPFAVELVMQIYMSSSDVIGGYLTSKNMDTDIQYYALTEVWSRVLDCVFNSVAKNLVVNE